LSQVLNLIDLKIPTIILEIGGYFAVILNELEQALGNNLIGIVEDTENGHRQYEQLKSLPCPVVSIARSDLKKAEDSLIGNACLFSTEKIIRETGYIIEGRRALVLGFGKIGRGLAQALARRNCHVDVNDSNPIKLTEAISEGFYIPEKTESLKNADIIFGTTGKTSISEEEYRYIKNGAILVSCSSKDVEFDLPFLRANYEIKEIFPNYTKYNNENKNFYLLAKGYPINFIDGSALGPSLALSQSEIILAIKNICELNRQGKKGMFTLDSKEKRMLAKIWLKHFCDPVTGYYF
jgi:adenosylhomocysteinase